MPTAEKLAKMFKPKSKMIKIRADELQPHPLAQRALIPARIRKLVSNFDLDAIGVLHAVEYAIKGKTAIWIIDGQHRWRALMELGLGEWQVEVKIHLDVEDDARASEVFLRLNDRSPVSPYDKFKNRLQAKDEVAVRINDIVVSHHMKISQGVGVGCIAGIAAVERCYDLDEGVALDKSLQIITQAWGMRQIDSKVIEGIGMVCARYNGVLDCASLAKRLSKYPGAATGLFGDARGLMEYRRGTLARCIAERVLDTYNSGRRDGRLDPL